MFNHVKGDIKKLDYLANFILDYSTPSGVYLKTYQPKGNFSDVENQEHASWQHYAMSYTYPKLTKTYSIKKLGSLIQEIQEFDSKLYISAAYNLLTQVLETAIIGYNDETITKEQCDSLYGELLTAKNKLIYVEADHSQVDEGIAKAEKLNEDNYKDFSKIETAINGVVRGKNITQQDEVDAMVKAINDAIIALEKKDEIVKPETNDAQVPNIRNRNLIIIYGTLISVSILCLSSLLKR